MKGAQALQAKAELHAAYLRGFGTLIDHVPIENECVGSLFEDTLAQKAPQLITAAVHIPNHDQSASAQLPC